MPFFIRPAALCPRPTATPAHFTPAFVGFWTLPERGPGAPPVVLNPFTNGRYFAPSGNTFTRIATPSIVIQKPPNEAGVIFTCGLDSAGVL